MKHPAKWRDTIDPFKLPYHHFELTEVLGYPHAGNDVFHAIGLYQQKEAEVYIKAAKQRGADIKREIDVLSQLDCCLLPKIIDYDEDKTHFVVTLAMEGERLSAILGNNEGLASLEYLYEYGQALALLHKTTGQFPDVKDRNYFHIPEAEYLQREGLQFVYEYLVKNQPNEINHCFCHGDFHYANVLWKDKHISAILDFELSGIGNKEFDIAWALILRPGQKFMTTKKEIDLFLSGYRSVGSFQMEYLKYYIVLIYSRFYSSGKNTIGYQDHVMQAFRTICIHDEPVR